MRAWIFSLCVVALGSGCRTPQSGAPATSASPAAPAPVASAPAAPAAESSQVPSLIGTSWQAEDIGGRSMVGGARSTLVFENEMRLVGSTGCNRYFAGLALSGTSLRVANVGSTRMACLDPGVMEQETRFVGALEGARTYRLDGKSNQLWLLGEDGRELARFSRMSSPVVN